MKVLLTIFALAVVTASAFLAPKGELNSRRNILPARNVKSGAVKHPPYQVALSVERTKNSDDADWCGGSLIDNRNVLTAAHCLFAVIKGIALLGAIDPQHYQIIYPVNKNDFSIHPGWNTNNYQNDIGIVRIPFTKFSALIQPVKLPSPNDDFPYEGEDIVFSGWSGTSIGKPKFKMGAVTIMSKETCTSYFHEIITNSTVCTYTGDKIDICKGDSGSPLVLKSTNTQIGISSFITRDVCKKNTPAVFTRVANFLTWIKDNLAK